MTSDPKIALLRRVPLFATCSRRELERVAQLCDEVDLPAGRVIIREGASGQEFFVIVEGSVKVERQGQQLREMGPGDFLGEIALIDDRPRSATATLSAPSRLLVLGHREFHTLLADHPAVQLQVLQALARRVRQGEPDAQ